MNRVNLPQEIIIEILSRLPVKAILRFRLVSKSWNFLIIDQSFIKKHLNQATKHQNLSHKRAILCTSSSSNLLSSPLSSLSYPDISEIQNIHPLETRNGLVMFLGSCNGLFCICMGIDLLLWNPSTRQLKKLPSPPVPLSINIHNVFLSFAVSAFGYDSHNDDYKVMRIVWFPASRFGTLLYSFKKDSWSIVEDHLPYRIDYQIAGTFVNGTFHWLVNHGPYSDAPYAIVSFDLTSEKYATLPMPDESVMPRSSDRNYNLAVLRGRLCLYCNYFRNHFVLWAMTDYGVENSWAEVLKFEYDAVFSSISRSRAYVRVVPKYLFHNGEMLLEVKGLRGDRVELVRYKKNDESPVTICCGICDELGEIHVYVETLVSPILHD